jgi:anti-sigma regulatory factor (Ser/Thr protein kinase)
MQPQLSCQLSRELTAPAAARGAMETFRGALDAQHLYAARLLVSELVTSAVKHGGRGPVRVDAANDGHSLHVEVVDRAPARRPWRRSENVEEVGGWGLPLIARVADRWGSFDGGSRAWFELDLEAG